MKLLSNPEIYYSTNKLVLPEVTQPCILISPQFSGFYDPDGLWGFYLLPSLENTQKGNNIVNPEQELKFRFYSFEDDNQSHLFREDFDLNQVNELGINLIIRNTTGNLNVEYLKPMSYSSETGIYSGSQDASSYYNMVYSLEYHPVTKIIDLTLTIGQSGPNFYFSGSSIFSAFIYDSSGNNIQGTDPNSKLRTLYDFKSGNIILAKGGGYSWNPLFPYGDRFFTIIKD